MIVWLPVSLREIEVLQLVPVWPIVWFWDSIRRYGINGTPRVAMEATIAGVICFYSCVHHALFLALSLVITAWPLLQSLPSPRVLFQTCCFALSGLSLIAIVYLPMRGALDSEQFYRSERLVQQLSATPESLFRTPGDSLLAQREVVGKAYSPGSVKISLAAIGCVFGVLRKKRRRWAMFLGLTVLVCALLANGPNLRIADVHPWQLLGDWIPGVRQVRNVFRFVYLFQIAVIFLAVFALQELKSRLVLRFPFARSSGLLIGACALIALFEVPKPSISLVGLPNLVQHQGWTEFLRTTTPDGRGIACLPFAAGSGVTDFDETVRWMYLSTLHGKPLVNGYSGFFPEESLNLNQLVTNEGLSSVTLSRLWSLKVHFVVVRRSDPLGHAAETRVDDAYTLRRVFRDTSGIDVYELHRNPLTTLP